MNNPARLMLALLTAIPVARGDEFCAAPLAAIPDNSPDGIEIPIEVIAGAGEVVEAISLGVEIEHPWIGDLVITLRSPGGQSVTLLDRPGFPSAGFPGPHGCGGRDIDAVFIDHADIPAQSACSYDARPVLIGQVAPAQPLDALAGLPAAGLWVVSISDHSAYDTGIALALCLELTTTSACPPDLTGDGVLNFFDISAFLGAFTAQAPAADFTGDGDFNFFDVSAFLAAFSAGCP